MTLITIIIILLCIFVICPISIAWFLVYIEDNDFSIHSKMQITFITASLYIVLMLLGFASIEFYKTGNNIFLF